MTATHRLCVPDSGSTFRAMCGRVYAPHEQPPECAECLSFLAAEIDAFDQAVERGEITLTPFPAEKAARLLSHLRAVARKGAV